MSNNTLLEENLEQKTFLTFNHSYVFPPDTLIFSIFEFFNDSLGTESPCHIIDPTWSVGWRQVDKDSLGEGGGCNGLCVSD